MPHRSILEEARARQVIIIPPTTTIRDVARIMRDHHVGSVVVARDGKVIEGICTERDVLIRCVAHGLDPDASTVREIMTVHPETADPSDSVQEVLRHMVAAGVRHMPVSDREGHAIGIVSMRDFVGREVEEMERDRAFAQHVAEVI